MVYLALHEQLQRLVAVKLVAAGVDQSRASAIIRAEAEAIARLRHPNIVQVFEIGQANGEPYLTLEYVNGKSLREWLLTNQLSQRRAAILVEQLARAIHHAHTHGIVHRDLKPANILLMLHESKDAASEGSGEQLLVPKITDFGLAKVLDALQNQTCTAPFWARPNIWP